MWYISVTVTFHWPWSLLGGVIKSRETDSGIQVIKRDIKSRVADSGNQDIKRGIKTRLTDSGNQDKKRDIKTRATDSGNQIKNREMKGKQAAQKVAGSRRARAWVQKGADEKRHTFKGKKNIYWFE